MSAPGPARLTWWQTAGYAACVGREREQQSLQAVLEHLWAGSGRLVIVSGEAGIGKTTLVGAVAARAAANGALVLTGTCDELPLATPYGPWSAIWRAYPAGAPDLPRLPPVLASAAAIAALPNQQAHFDEIERFVRQLSAHRPLLLVLEDLHWSDPASLDLLHHLARAITHHRLVLMATYRGDEVDQQRPLYRLLPALLREAGRERITLTPFTDDETRALVASTYRLSESDQTRLVDYLRARSDGNPFFISELLRALEAERLLTRAGAGWQVGNLRQASVPGLVRQVIETRASNLDATARDLLAIAAVIGQTVPMDLWLAASETIVEVLDQVVQQALDARLFREPSDIATVAFRHALVRDALYSAQPLSSRRARHCRVADVLLRHPQPSHATIAGHLDAADDIRAIDHFVLAGEQALSLFAAEDAVAAITRAQALTARHGHTLPGGAYRTRAAALALAGQFERARADYETVLERARADHDRQAEWQALLDLGLHWAERDYERTGAYSRAALELARTLDDHAIVAASLNRVANWHANVDEPDQAMGLHQEALALFDAAGDNAGIADTLDHLGVTSFLRCDQASSTDYSERAAALFRRLGDRQRLAGCLSVIAACGASGAFDLEAAGVVFRAPGYFLHAGEEAVAITREIGWPAGEAFALLCLAGPMASAGDLAGALRVTQQALAIAERIGHPQWATAARASIGLYLAAAGDRQAAVADMERALAQAHGVGSRFWITTTTVSLARTCIGLGELDRARALLETMTRAAEPRPTVGDRHSWLAWAELALAQGDPSRCLLLLDQLVSGDAPSTREDRLPYIQLVRGQALVSLRRDDAAERLYLAARHTADVAGFRSLLWQVDAALARLYCGQRRDAEAVAAAESARATIAKIATSFDDQSMRAQFEAAALAKLPVQFAVTHHAVSPRELDVLRLIVEGKSDREIAARLAISPRTVMRHVTGILNKLGVSSRTAAATLAIRQRIV